MSSVCDVMHDSMNAYKSETDASVNSLRSEMNQNIEVNNQVGDTTAEIRSVASSLEEYNSSIQTDRQVYESEIQKLNSEIGNLREKLYCNEANRTPSAPLRRLVQ